MAASEQSSEQRELSLIGKVEMRIALADTDQKLETTLKTYLAPLLLKLASDHVSVRNKVIAVCQHISTRTKPQTIQLPVAALIQQFTEQSFALIRHFDLVYIQQGVPRLSLAERASLLPVVMRGISKSGKHGSTMFNLMLHLLQSFTFPSRGSKDDNELRSRFDISAEDAEYIADWIGKLVLFVPKNDSSRISPGLSPDEHDFLNLEGKENAWNPAYGGLALLPTKTLATKLLSTGLFNEAERFLPALFASVDQASSISDLGEDMLKRCQPVADLESDVLITRLFQLYFGHNRTPRVKIPLRIKILSILARSKLSTTFEGHIDRLVNDGIASSSMDGDDVVMSNTTSRPAVSRETVKLRSAVFAYLNYAARYGEQQVLNRLSTKVVARLRDFVENQGWPKLGLNEDLVSRAYAYEVIGVLTKVGPRSLLVEEEQPIFDLLRWLLESLALDTSGNSIVVSIEESLAVLLGALARMTLSTDEQDALEHLLIEQMMLSTDLASNKRLRSTKFIVLRIANRCLPYKSVRARWIDILGIGSSADRAEIQEEAEKGLSPYWHCMLNGVTAGRDNTPSSIAFPSFTDLTEQFMSGRVSDADQEPILIAREVFRTHPGRFSRMLAYLRRAICQDAIQKLPSASEIDASWERRMDAAIKNDNELRRALEALLQQETNVAPRPVRILVAAMLTDFVEQISLEDEQTADFLELCPTEVLQEFSILTPNLMAWILCNNHTKRLLAARVFGLMSNYDQIRVSAPSYQPAEELWQICLTWETASGAAVNKCHGALIALGYYYSRLEAVDSAKSAPTPDKFVKLQTSILASVANESLKEAACLSLGQMAIFQAVSIKQLTQNTSAQEVIDALYGIAKTGKESVILSMGQIGMLFPEQESGKDDLAHLIDQLHQLHEIRQAEAHFSVGEAFSYILGGWSSTTLAAKISRSRRAPVCPERRLTPYALLDRIITDCMTTKPTLKKAAVMWLMCLIQFCGHLPVVQEQLTRCQSAFKRCLSDRDELIQESASRGLGLIYEHGDKRLKDDLVRDLVASFSSDQQTALSGNVTAETQLFEPGALPTGDGSVSTYKDIMSLASEVGDSSLVYKFMSMASSNAIWSSRAAFGRFGLSNVLSSSSVDGYLADNPKLYPKLYRYRFDPHSGVQRSMNDIWNALVKDSAATIDKYFDSIMDDLLVAILGKEWRTRQASCAAIADLVQGRTLDKYENYLERIWAQCFRVLDDIKESVRAAATTLARVLTGILTRTLETDHTAGRGATTMLKHVLPFLLSGSGMESSAEDVRLFAVTTLLEIIKKSNGPTLRPFIPELVERLLGSLSSLEPEAVNYIHLNASKYNLTEQKIDSMRLSSVRASPLMEAIERCLDLLDETSMNALQPRLEQALKSAIGLPSKVGTSRVIVSLATRRLPTFRPYADGIIRQLEKVVVDRNETVSSSYAIAIGYVARAITEKQLLQLMTFVQKLYFDTEGDRDSSSPRNALVAGEIVSAIAKQASDRFNSVAASVLPFVFFAKHDGDDSVKEQFRSTWEESVGGSRAVFLYLDEIIDLSAIHLDSAHWHLKHTSARSIADCVSSLTTTDAEIHDRVNEKLWSALEKALGGKTWEGKEVVLSAFVAFVKKSSDWIMDRSDKKVAVVKFAIREAKRQNATYKQHAVKALGDISLALPAMNMFDEVYAITQPLILDLSDQENRTQVDAGGEKAAKQMDETNVLTLANACTAIISSVNPSNVDSSQLEELLLKALRLSNTIQPVPNQVVRAVFAALIAVLDRIRNAKGDVSFSTAVESELEVAIFKRPVGTEAMRAVRIDCITAMAKTSRSLRDKFTAHVNELISQETSRPLADRLRLTLAGHDG